MGARLAGGGLVAQMAARSAAGSPQLGLVRERQDLVSEWQVKDKLGIPLARRPGSGQPLPFDRVRAHRLYVSLFGEPEDLVRGKHLLIVPSGPLTQLPFHVLVTEAPQGRALACASVRASTAVLLRSRTGMAPCWDAADICATSIAPGVRIASCFTNRCKPTQEGATRGSLRIGAGQRG